MPRSADNPTPTDVPYRPAWLRHVPFLVHPPLLTQRQWRVLLLITAASLFDRYDLSLFSLALPQIQAELGIPEAHLGMLGAIVRLGAAPAVFLTLVADTFGRRRLLLLTIVAYTILTGATALAPDARTFVLLQSCSRTFLMAELALGMVVIVEEFDPAVRGWGIGALHALSAAGHGLAWLFFGLIHVLPFGWRALYVIGLVPLGLIAFMRRTLPETERFAHHHTAQRPTLSSTLTPFRHLWRMYPGRFTTVSLVVFLASMAESPAAFFDPKYLQEVHAWQPWHIACLGVGGGFIAIFGYTYAGWLGDRFGRKRMTLLFLAINPLLTIAFYNTAGLGLPLFWVAMHFTLLGGHVSLATYGAELFPTSYRSTASGARVVFATAGAVLGLVVQGLLYTMFGSHWLAISVIMLAALVAAVLVACTFPETSGRTLEDIAPER